MSGHAAYTQRFKVSWGDCDPAGILYTPKVFEYCTRLLEGWYRDVAGMSWPDMIRQGLGSPMVHVECDFMSQMAADADIAVSLHLEKVGNSSLTFRIEGAGNEGNLFFRAIYVACITDFHTAKATPIPESMRARALAYQKDCG